MGIIVGLISTGIGLAIDAASEYQSSRKSEGKRRNSNSEQEPTHGPRDRYLEENQAQRDAKAFAELQLYADFQRVLSNRVQDDILKDEKRVPTDPQILPQGQQFDDYFSHQPYFHSSLQQSDLLRKLPRPVLIPQQQSADRSRGWVRAYAPALMKCGIDQYTFLDFVDAFNESSKSTPNLDAVNVARLGADYAPGRTPMSVSMAVPLAVKISKAAQSEIKTTSFLTRANAELFLPHGLFAMIMTYRPGTSSQSNTFDTSQPTSCDTTSSGPRLPEAAPLIYPESNPTPTANQQNKFKQIAHFIADYGDKRMQSRNVSDRHASTDDTSSSTFPSRWSDYKSPSKSGSLPLLSVRSGRLEKRPVRKDRRRKGSSSHNNSRKEGESQNSGVIRSVKDGARENESKEGLMQQLNTTNMQQGALYLVIVNNPLNESESSTPTQTPYHFLETKDSKSVLEPDPFQYNAVWTSGSGLWSVNERSSKSADQQRKMGKRDRSPPPAYESQTSAGQGNNGYVKRGRGRGDASQYCVPTL